MGDNCLLEGQVGQEDFGALEPEDDLDAFNDETFGDGIGDAWQEDAHEQLAKMTEQERIALKQSSEFFDFGSDGEELGGELEDALEPPPKQNGGSHGMVERLDQLSLQSGTMPPPPLTVQTNPPPMVPMQQGYPQPAPPMPNMYMQPQQMVPHPQHPQHPQHPNFPLLPPSHFAPPNTQFQDPAIMSLSKMPPPPQFLPQSYSHPQHPQALPPPHFQPPPQRPHTFSPPTVPGMKSMADLEAEMLYGARPPGPPPAMLPPTVTPTPVLNERSGQLGHINPAIHNLSYPGMRDRHNHPIQPQNQTHNQQHQQPPPPSQFRNSPSIPSQSQPANQGFHQQQVGHNKAQQPPQQQQQPQQQQHQPQQQQQLPRSNNNNNNMGKPSPTGHNQMDDRQFHHGNDRRNDQFSDRRNDQFGDRRNDHYRNDQFNDRRNDQFNDRRNDQFFDRRNDHYDNRRNDRYEHHNRHYDNRNSYNEETFGPGAGVGGHQHHRYQDRDHGQGQATRRDLVPGHVHTLGILRHSRSRHDRDNAETFGEEGELGGDALLINPTGDPLLDAKMLEEQEELAKRRKHYASSEDEYAGLMSQRDKQWIINIQLNQLKCDNPYVDDYYYTMYQAKREAENNEDSKAGGQLLLNESMDHSSYTPTQFENSLGKLQVVTVKAPRQIIDVGVVRSTDSPVSHTAQQLHEGSPAPGAVVVEQGHKKQGSDYKQVLIQIEVLYMALLDLESDQLKLSALPTGAPLREQVSSDEETHLHLLQSGLSSSDWLADCLAVPKGRSLVLRALSHLTPSKRTAILHILLGKLHLLARGDKEDAKWWGVLAKHIALESRDSLESGAAALLSLKRKTMMSLLTISLGSSVILTMVLKASLANGGDNLNIWTQLASVLLSCVAEGGNLGAFLVKFTLTEATLDRLLTLDGNQKPAWLKIMALSSAMENNTMTS